ncbi:hypothetical protein VTN49DRAFT_2418 [Thermomyces lanuginosus]|uniref:uncharacterized protein n=1 Tax=Thermomyces lanuginosus TaxID=5541 RepID=UPI0037438D52
MERSCRWKNSPWQKNLGVCPSIAEWWGKPGHEDTPGSKPERNGIPRSTKTSLQSVRSRLFLLSAALSLVLKDTNARLPTVNNGVHQVSDRLRRRPAAAVGCCGRAACWQARQPPRHPRDLRAGLRPCLPCWHPVRSSGCYLLL